MQGLEISTILQQTVYQIFIISLPILLTAMVVGLIISIFQATTSIQEQTLTFVPKLFAILLILILVGPFLYNSLSQYTIFLFNLIGKVRL